MDTLLHLMNEKKTNCLIQTTYQKAFNILTNVRKAVSYEIILCILLITTPRYNILIYLETIINNKEVK